MEEATEEVYCRKCSELLFRIVRGHDGTVQMKDPALAPESDGIHKYYRCPTCRGKNLEC